MRPIIDNPPWLEKYNFNYSNLEAVPHIVFERLNKSLRAIQTGYPLVSILISAWNEEVTILKTIASLADMVTYYPLEIIVVNNNSTDRTQDTLDRLEVKSFFQPVQGWGPARQMGLEQASGTYVLTADADCVYPRDWVNCMIDALAKPGVVCAYGRYSFIADKHWPRWQLAVFECLKDSIAALRQLKRPFLNAYGMSMAFSRKEALKAGFVMHRVRGEDGRLCYDLMKFGRVVMVTAANARVWTGTRTLQQDGTFSKALKKRLINQLRNIHDLFTKIEVHDTKTSSND